MADRHFHQQPYYYYSGNPSSYNAPSSASAQGSFTSATAPAHLPYRPVNFAPGAAESNGSRYEPSPAHVPHVASQTPRSQIYTNTNSKYTPSKAPQSTSNQFSPEVGSPPRGSSGHGDTGPPWSPPSLSNAYVPRSLVEENNYERTNPDTRRYPQSGPSKHHAAYAQRSPQYHRRARSSTHSFGQPTVRPDNWVSEQDGPSRQRGAREGPRQLPAFGQNLEAVQSMSDRATEPPGSPGEQSFIALDKSYKRHPPRYYVMGRVFLMVETTPAKDDSESAVTSGWTRNSYGLWIYTKPRRFIVVKSAGRSSLCVPIVTYGGQGVAKRGVTKSDHCIVHTGSIAPDPRPGELPHPPEQGMQATPIRVDSDDRTIRLDEMSRIDFSKPVSVDDYNVVKNFGKVHPDSIQALVSQFRNVMDPSRVQRVHTTAVSRMIALESSRTRYLRAYSALINDGWPQQKAAAFVNCAVRGERLHHQGQEDSHSDSETERENNDKA